MQYRITNMHTGFVAPLTIDLLCCLLEAHPALEFVSRRPWLHYFCCWHTSIPGASSLRRKISLSSDAMPADSDIVLEDGTIWDGSDPEEPFLYRRLKLCQSCQSLVASPERIESLKACNEIICSGSEDGSFTCSMRAIALAAIERWNCKQREIMRWTGESYRGRQLIKDPSQHTFQLSGISRDRDGQGIESFCMGHPWLGFGDMYVLLDFDVYTFPGIAAFLLHSTRANRFLGIYHKTTYTSSADDPAAKYISQRPVMADVANGSSQQIKSWLNTCCKAHPECPDPLECPLPTRVLHIGSEVQDPSLVRIHETRGEIGTYIALSYCWGAPQPVRLMDDTYERLTSMDGFDLRTLPQTIQDAIHVTRSLGLSYLWVDALCIIQQNPEDMTHELGVMASIYKNAYITISAASAKTCQDGFLEHKGARKSIFPRFELPYRAWDDTPTTPPGRLLLQESSYYYAYQEPANQRAWCLQESMLSPRLVVFGTHELLWHCREKDCLSPPIAGGRGQTFMQGLERLPPPFFDPTKALRSLDFEYAWFDVIINYSQRGMSFEDDKLVALSGLASEFQKLSKGKTYVAGLWGPRVTDWLGWIVDPSPEADRVKGLQTLQPRPAKYVAPSWSWAAIKGIISVYGGKNFRGELLRCEVTLRDESLPFGAVTGGVLELRVQVKETRWSRLTGEVGERLFEGTDTESKPMGKVFMDAEEERPDSLFCINLYGWAGHAAVKKGPSTYMRVGWFEIGNGVRYAGDWWTGCAYQVITII